ncbi:MAG: hypothetical protein KA758_10885 [Acidimicrobiales bacterium]|nr:hypothetical protein [Acidimicrobiales bacterium]
MADEVGRLDGPIRHFELARYSGMSVGHLPGGLEKLLPLHRTERISLFPAWGGSSRVDLLEDVIGRLERFGFRTKMTLRLGRRRPERVAVGESARRSYEAEFTASDPGWPALALVLEREGDDGVVLCSDLDGSTLFIDAWGVAAFEVEDELFDLIWSTTRKRR